MTVALVGGLLAILGIVIGATLRPYTDHWFERRRRTEDRGVERNAEIREMVKQRVDFSKREIQFATTVGVLTESGASGDDAGAVARDQAGAIFAPELKEFWRPEFIGDSLLRAKCAELDSAVETLIHLALGATHDGLMEKSQLIDMIPYESPRMSTLQAEIHERLRELQW